MPWDQLPASLPGLTKVREGEDREARLRPDQLHGSLLIAGPDVEEVDNLARLPRLADADRLGADWHVRPLQLFPPARHLGRIPRGRYTDDFRWIEERDAGRVAGNNLHGTTPVTFGLRAPRCAPGVPYQARPAVPTCPTSPPDLSKPYPIWWSGGMLIPSQSLCQPWHGRNADQDIAAILSSPWQRI